ncbi:hypothetical protein TNCV_411231 [Trichonephila clavipes]|nr:hypothetical protein TNCV_411231 [Trichonephila clavipes]
MEALAPKQDDGTPPGTEAPRYHNNQSQSSLSQTRGRSKDYKTSHSHNMPRIAATPLVRQSDLPRLSLAEGVASKF